MHSLNHTLNPTSVYINVSNWFERHPRTVRHAMRVSMAVAAGFTLFNAGLFTVQNGRTSALTTINGKNYGLMPIKEAQKLLETEHSAQALNIRIGDITAVLNAKEVGVAVDADKPSKPLPKRKA